MTRRLHCLIIDDEPFARKGLQRYVEQIPFLELRGVCADPLELRQQLAQQPADLLFLDIEMPRLSGLDFLRQATAPPPRVVLTTAYEQFALAGFELDVLDYLLKPISFKRFMRAASKAYDYFRLREQHEATAGYCFVKADGRLEKVVFADILFVEGLENYVTIYTRERTLRTHSTLKALLARLPPANFVQTHKSYAVAASHVEALEGNLLRLRQYQVPLSKAWRPHVLARLGIG